MNDSIATKDPIESVEMPTEYKTVPVKFPKPLLKIVEKLAKEKSLTVAALIDAIVRENPSVAESIAKLKSKLPEIGASRRSPKPSGVAARILSFLKRRGPTDRIELVDSLEPLSSGPLTANGESERERRESERYRRDLVRNAVNRLIANGTLLKTNDVIAIKEEDKSRDDNHKT